jgi:hypothetical protein
MPTSLLTRPLRCALVAVLAVVCACSAAASAHATALAPELDIQGRGLSVRSASIGLRALGNNVYVLKMDTPPAVQAARLYWSGQDRPCPVSGISCIVPFQPYEDQQLFLDGSLLTGTVVGTETQPASADGPSNNIAYSADVTSIVQSRPPGPHLYALDDPGASADLDKLDGATLMVVYEDPAVDQMRRLMLFDGLDFALGNDATPGESRVTSPVALNHGAAPVERTGELSVLVGSATASGADRLSISGNGTTSGCLDGSSGNAWDHDSVPVSIPAGTESTTVRVSSPSDAPEPDYLNWVAATMLVSLDGSVDAANTCPPLEPEPAPIPDPAPLPGGGTPAPPPATGSDRAAPVLSDLRVAPRAAARARVRYRLSETAKVRFVVERRRGGRFVRVQRPFTVKGATGANAFRLRNRVRLARLRPGRYRVRAVATDAAGDRSPQARVRFRLVR